MKKAIEKLTLNIFNLDASETYQKQGGRIPDTWPPLQKYLLLDK
jgi:hypothetical protein